MKSSTVFFCLWTAALAAFILACGSAPPEPAGTPLDLPEVETEPEPEPSGTPVAVIETERGIIEIELLPELAPLTVENFKALVEQRFYYRTLFHRVMRDTMIQGGDPLSRDSNPYNDGQGGSGRFLQAEFSNHRFDRGTVAMARQPHDPDSASSQFFIVLKRVPEWDREYTAFGRVVSGIEVAEEISRAPLSREPQLRDRPAANIRIRETRIEYR